MFNPIAKTARYLRREYPFKTAFTGLMFGIGVAVSAVVTLGTPGVPLLLPLLMPVGLAVFSLGFVSLTGGESNRPSENSTTVNDIKLVGNVKDVASISMTQDLISSYTKKWKHEAELPQRVQKAIAAHIADIEPRLKRVRFFDGQGKPAIFSFTREIYDATGEIIQQPVGGRAAAALPATSTLSLAAPTEAPALSHSGRPAEEFVTLARKMDEVSSRVERLENPPVVKLDKPALRR